MSYRNQPLVWGTTARIADAAAREALDSALAAWQRQDYGLADAMLARYQENRRRESRR